LTITTACTLDNRRRPNRTPVLGGPNNIRYCGLTMTTSEEAPVYLAELDRAIRQRESSTAFKLLEDHQQEVENTDPSAPYALELLLCVARWIDLGFTKTEMFERLYAACAVLDRSSLRAIDYLRLHLVEAFRAAYHEELNLALHHLDLVRVAGEDILPLNLKFLTFYWTGRWLRRKGEYEQALGYIKSAQALAVEMQAPRLVAVTKIHESWLIFQKGERRAAFDLLDEAERELAPTNHFLSLGNIESARGRFVRRAGEYTLALAHFEKAIALFSSVLPEHVNLARALVNAAYVKRLIALDMGARRKVMPAKGRHHERHLRIVGEALNLLDRARAIYACHHHQSGTGSVLVNAGHLHLDVGDIARADDEAVNAFALGKEQQDVILMARARSLQSAVALERAEEQLGEEPDAALHANLAVRHATEAIELAQGTQNRRLLAEAFLARGNAATQPLLQEWEVARECLARASELLTSDDKDHLLQDLNALRGRILKATTIDERLRRWSSGELSGESFQQVEEAFAEIVIPKVWMKYGKNVARVAEALSISPKKVRRILKNVGER
jgi:tetratricopeptide (TPR) repeat protein